jgi:cob(I)alamin adenosyltransferase
MKSRSITTKIGDQGTTRLFSGEEVSKDSPRTDAYGDMDELVSVLGIARSVSTRKDVRDRLKQIQRDLFIAGAELATSLEHAHRLDKRVDEAMVRDIDRKREVVEGKIRMPRGFILPGATIAAAHIDHARTIARRCERKVVGLLESGLIENRPMIIWFNRLSDYLWLLARLEEGERTQPKDESPAK